MLLTIGMPNKPMRDNAKELLLTPFNIDSAKEAPQAASQPDPMVHKCSAQIVANQRKHMCCIGRGHAELPAQLHGCVTGLDLPASMYMCYMMEGHTIIFPLCMVALVLATGCSRCPVSLCVACIRGRPRGWGLVTHLNCRTSKVSYKSWLEEDDRGLMDNSRFSIAW
jgi:hypothetical protein